MLATDEHRAWLIELTGTPTATGREDRIRAWVEQWVHARNGLKLSRDPAGNLVISRHGVSSGRPLYFTAHMDHPAFVVATVKSDREVIAQFRGGVRREYFAGTPVLLHHGTNEPTMGVVDDFVEGEPQPIETKRADPLVRVTFDHAVDASPGDVITWDVGPSRVEGDLLYAPACDDLAGLTAALAAYDALVADRGTGNGGPVATDVRLLLTRAEEVGFIGAIAACKYATVPHNARLVCLEASKSFAESPIGGGPIVRVGDRTSTFDPALTYAIGTIAQKMAAEDDTFKVQRKLMAGGTCEASAFQAYGYTATCLCLPLGNYHNMDESTTSIAPEYISLSDFDGLVRLLIAIGKQLDSPDTAPALIDRLEKLYEGEQYVLGS